MASESIVALTQRSKNSWSKASEFLSFLSLSLSAKQIYSNAHESKVSGWLKKAHDKPGVVVVSARESKSVLLLL